MRVGYRKCKELPSLRLTEEERTMRRQALSGPWCLVPAAKHPALMQDLVDRIGQLQVLTFPELSSLDAGDNPPTMVVAVAGCYEEEFDDVLTQHGLF